jgi:peptide/nickel transport system permease protein
VALLALAAVLAPRIAAAPAGLSPLEVNLAAANLPPGIAGHILGTDYLGRDIAREAMWGARASLSVGLLAAGLAVSFGALWGSFSAFTGGPVGAAMMRLVDGLLAIPSLILVLALQSVISSPKLAVTLPPAVLAPLRVTSYSEGLLPLFTIVIVISATAWLEAARVAHAQILAIKSQEYVEAARALGTSTARMLVRHLLPNAAVPLLVEASLLVSDAVLMEAGLSFLGFGLGPSIPSWGGMLASAQMSLLNGNWWAALTPGLCISTLVLSVNLIGEGFVKLSQR